MGAEHREGTVGVGAQHPGALGAELRDGAGRGVAVRITGAHRYQGQARRQAVYQLGILIGRAVVCHLEDVDGRQLRVGGQQGLLGGRFEVAEQQEGQTARPHEQGDAGVVGVGGNGGRCLDSRSRRLGGRPEDLPAQGAQAATLPGHGADDRHMGRRGPAAYELGLP